MVNLVNRSFFVDVAAFGEIHDSSKNMIRHMISKETAWVNYLLFWQIVLRNGASNRNILPDQCRLFTIYLQIESRLITQDSVHI